MALKSAETACDFTILAEAPLRKWSMIDVSFLADFPKLEREIGHDQPLNIEPAISNFRAMRALGMQQINFATLLRSI